MSVMLGTFATCLLSGSIFPWINSELVVIGAAAVLPRELLAPLVLLATAGQMLGKTSIFAIARWTPERLPEGARKFLDRAAALGQSKNKMTAALVASAVFGMPPFYLMTLAAGTLGFSLRVFVVAGAAGTLLRYTAIAVGIAWVGAGVT